jgi:hypothetical protein
MSFTDGLGSKGLSEPARREFIASVAFLVYDWHALMS